MSYQSGFVAIIGRPNVGKSTLLNALIGQKVAIMSNRPQTTRNRIRGVLTREDAQIVFIDTPGIHKPRHRLGEYMVEAAIGTLREVDVIVVVVDATDPVHEGDNDVLTLLDGVTTPTILCINKVDATDKPRLLEMISRFSQRHPFTAIIPISAKDGTQLDELTDVLIQQLPEGPQYYPKDMVTDHPEQFIIAETIREKVLFLTREEIPHSVMVHIEQLERRETGNTVYVHAIIYTERDSQKGILIGKGGGLLKKVGEMARVELERLLGSKLYLELWVKVKKDWRNEPSMLHRFGFDDL